MGGAGLWEEPNCREGSGCGRSQTLGRSQTVGRSRSRAVGRSSPVPRPTEGKWVGGQVNFEKNKTKRKAWGQQDSSEKALTIHAE